jgi:putative FmdB family regulatory protein
MPKYTFECAHCSVRFDRNLKMGEHPTHECPSCKGLAPRFFSGNGFGFGFSSHKSSSPANTGVHGQDYPTADMVVGRSAEERWNTYRARDEVKKKVRKGGGSPPLSRVDGDGYIEYASMGPETLKARGKLVDYAVQVERSSKGT